MEKLDGKYVLFGFLFILNQINYSISIPEKKRLYNCFKDIDDGTCEESRIIIDGYYYECDNITLLHAPPSKINIDKGEIRFVVGSITYTIFNETVVVTDRIPRISSHISDSRGNIYFVEDGVPFVYENNTGNEIEIISLENTEGPAQLAIDHKVDKLFILSFSSDTTSKSIGQLFTISTGLINVADGKIKAELVRSARNRITALAIDNEQQSLVLGIAHDVGNMYATGKIVILKRREIDPCSNRSTNKLKILELIKELQDEILRLIDDAPDSAF